MDRRTALRVGVAAVVGTATGLAGPAAGFGRGQRLDWAALVRGLSPGATLYRPGEASYQPLSIPFNHRYADIRPAGILTPVTTQDIAHAVRWARAYGVPIVPRSSAGHNYAGFSTTPGLVVLASRLRGIRVRPAGSPPPAWRDGASEVVPDAGTVTVEAGVVNADLRPLLEQDGIMVPAGRCPTVGLAGLSLGGGIGFSDKMFGLTCDALVSTRVVLADGSVVSCDETNHPDLFWACRGGAGNNFGINTSFTFRYEQLRGAVTFFRLSWGHDSAVPALVALQQIAEAAQADPRFDCRLGLGTAGQTPPDIRRQLRASALGQFFGSPEELTAILGPALAVGTAPEQRANQAGIFPAPPATAAQLLSATTPLIQFGAKSAVLPAPLTAGQLETVVAHLLRWPGSRNPDGAGIALFAMGGRVNQVPADATAFVHRSALFILAAEASWDDADPPALGSANLDWLERCWGALFADRLPVRAYQNFPDPELLDWRRAYYGGNYRRLVEVKRRYDPEGVFTYGQGIGS